ncbi:hypothetical protein OsccyDRAFT_0550 [Leptolyngbyaceae cyanobacterium JSC-12]|nr:hypothetical protein OsccyDRAFT_0550 [Leptolyngbyaceae cyanobacterium JSC-12]
MTIKRTTKTVSRTSKSKVTPINQKKVNTAKKKLEEQTEEPPTVVRRGRKLKPKPEEEPISTEVVNANETVEEPVQQSLTDFVQLAARNPSSSALAELEPFKFDYQGLDQETITKLKNDTLTLKGLVRERHLAALQMGQIIAKWKEQLPYGVYTAWVTKEFGEIMSADTANNYCMLAELYKNYSAEELNRLPLNALYVIGRRTVSPEVREEVLLAAAQSSKKMSKKDVEKIIKSYRELQIEIAGVSDQAKPLLVHSSIAENPEELQRFAKLSAKRQTEVAGLLAAQPNPTSLRQVVSQLQTTRRKDEEKEDTLEAEIIATANYQNIVTKRGSWLQLLAETESESVDLCFAEMPLNKGVLEDYGRLAQEMNRVLRPGGLLLATVGQQNLQFVGGRIEPALNVAWTFMLLRRPGHSPRVVGRISFASSFVPLTLCYKPPLKALPGLIDDLRSWAPENDMKFHYKDDDDDLPSEETVELASLESSLAYYMKALLAPSETFMHLVYEQKNSFGVTDSLYKSVFEVNAEKVFSLIGN